MIDIQAGLQLFMGVLVFGTIWRLAQFHLMASQTPAWSHLGMAMAVQY